MRQRCYDAQNLGGDPQNCPAPLLVCVGSTQAPGLFSSEIFVGGGDNGPDQLERAGEFKSVIVFEDLADGGLCDFDEFGVLWLKVSGLGNFSAKTALDHGGGATGKITQAVGEIAVVASDKSFATETAVSAENNFTQQKVT